MGSMFEESRKLAALRIPAVTTHDVVKALEAATGERFRRAHDAEPPPGSRTVDKKAGVFHRQRRGA